MTKTQMPEYCVQETKEGEHFMQQPFWKLNLGLFLTVCALLIAMFFYRVPVRRPVSIEPAEITDHDLAQKTTSIDLEKIYRNDLFRTTFKGASLQSEKESIIRPVPPPPQPEIVPPPPVVKPQFLDPLPLTLTGVFMLNDEAKNRAIILNTKTNEETTYKVGDEVKDAQIVAIFPNKVLLVRSNGQREMLYIRQDTATADMISLTKKDWSRVVKKLSDQQYLVDRQEFIDEIGSISNFIDMFNLVTAYKQGKSIGIKIGMFDETSLAHIFDFVPGDIIVTIDKLPVNTTKERLAVYKHVVALTEGTVITINYTRKGQPGTLSIKLGSILQPLITTTKQEGKIKESDAQKVQSEERERQINLLRQKEHFAPTLRDLRLKEKENIIRHQRAMESHKREDKD